MSHDPGVIIDVFRQAACGMRAWTDGLALIAQATGGHTGQIAMAQAPDLPMMHILSGAVASADMLAAYVAARGDDPAVNPRTRALIHATPFRTFDDAACVTDADRERPLFRDLFRRVDVPYGLYVRLDTAPGLVTGMALMRSQSQGPVTPDGVALLDAVARGIASALHAGLSLGTLQDRSMVDTAEMLSGPAILLGRGLRVVSLSGAAADMAERGTHLTIRQGRLRLANARSQQALAAAYRMVTAPDPAARALRRFALLSADGEAAMLAELCPLPERTAGPLSQASALLTIRTRSARDPAEAADILRDVFALTPAEADVALLLAAGHDLEHAAARRRSSVATVRTQLRNLFEKTGTRRQGELVARLRAFC